MAVASQSTADRAPGLRRHREASFLVVAVLVSIATLELGSAAIWTLCVSKALKENVTALTGLGEFPVQKLPNTFWHHEFNPQHPKYKHQLNAQGTKGLEFSVPKPPGELRVVCVGDSTVEGTGVAPNETFPYYLEEILRENIHLWPQHNTVQVINGGVGSHNSAFSLAYLEFRLLHFNPDVVVIKSSYNDYLPYIIPGMTYDYTHAFPKPYRISESSTPYWSLARYSYFLKLVGIVLFGEDVTVPFRDFSGHLTREQFQKMDFSSNADKFFIYAENIRSMILLSKGRGIDVLLVDLPTSPDPDHFGKDRTFGIRFKSLINRFEIELERIAAEEQVLFVRTGPFDRQDFWDHAHNTAAGNKKIAESVAKAVLALRMLRNGDAARAAEPIAPADAPGSH
jgi:lysophospholipase L1-like esterase